MKLEITNEDKHKNELQVQFSAINIDTESIEKLRKQIELDRASLDQISKKKYTFEANIKNSEKNIKEYDIILTEYNERQIVLRNSKEKLQILEQLEKAFKAVKAKILEDTIRELEKEAQKILRRLSNGRLSLSFVTEKSDKIVFEVHINDGEKTLPFSLYSGGEQFRIAFALRIALSKLLLRKANSQFEFLIIDEAVSPLDASGVENAMSIINELQEDFKTILVITHRTDIKNLFDQVITVYRDENGSRIV